MASLVLVLGVVVATVACQPKVPALRVSVSVPDAVVAVGEQVTFEVTVTNTGAADSAGVELRHALPAEISFHSAAPGAGTCTDDGGTVICSLPGLARGAQTELEIVGTAQSPGVVSAVTTVSNVFPSLVVEHDSQTSAISVLAEPPTTVLSDTFTRPDADELGVAETGQSWSILSGGWGVAGTRAQPTVAGYSMAVADGGSSVGTFEATVRELSDEFWLVLRATDAANHWRFGRTDGGDYVLQRVTNNVVTPIAPLVTLTPSPDDRLRCVLTASSIGCFVGDQLVALTNDTFNHSSTHHGLAAFDIEEPPAVVVDDVTFDHPAPTPVLELTMDASADSVTVGDPITYTMTVTNTGDGAATAVRLEDVLPEPVLVDAVTPSQGSCTQPDTSFTCELGAIPVGGQATVTLATTASEPGLATNTADVFHDDPFAEHHDSASNAVAIVVPSSADVVDTFTRPDASTLGTAETGQPWTALLGSWAVTDETAQATGSGYHLAVVDGGDSSGTLEVSVPSISSEYWMIVRASSPQSYWRFGRLGDGNYVLQRVENDVLAPTGATELATVTPAAGDRLRCDFDPASLVCSVNGVPVVQTAFAFNIAATHHGLAAYDGSGSPAVRFDDLQFTQLPPAPLLVLSATPSASSVVVGEPVSYDLEVGNTGDAAADVVRVEATVPAQTTITDVVTSQGTCSQSDATVTCDLGAVPAAGSATITITTDTVDTGIATLHADVFHDVPPLLHHDNATATIAILPANVGNEVIDSFSRPNQPTLGLAETGHLWIEDTGSWAVEDGHAVHTSIGYGKATVDAGAAFGYFDVVIGEPTQEFWIIFHQSDPLNYWRFGSLNGSKYVLHRIENGQLGTGGFHLTFGEAFPAPGDVIRVRLLSDDSIDVFVNGQHIVGTGSFFNINETKFGIASFRGSEEWPTPRFDLVQFTPFTDDFPEPPHD